MGQQKRSFRANPLTLTAAKVPCQARTDNHLFELIHHDGRAPPQVI